MSNLLQGYQSSIRNQVNTCGTRFIAVVTLDLQLWAQCKSNGICHKKATQCLQRNKSEEWRDGSATKVYDHNQRYKRSKTKLMCIKMWWQLYNITYQCPIKGYILEYAKIVSGLQK